VPSIEKIQQLLGWQATKNLDEILRLVIADQRAGSVV